MATGARADKPCPDILSIDSIKITDVSEWLSQATTKAKKQYDNEGTFRMIPTGRAAHDIRILQD